jgi:tRNA(Ile)-lysidine synthase
MDLSQIESFLITECKLDKNQDIVVGVSGGADSLCLLHLLHRFNYSLIVAHVNHQLRQEADSEEEYVKSIAGDFGLPFYAKKVDVKAYSSEKKLSTEESARYLRYAYLFQVAKENDAQALAVAHHADDQVETVLMHILRGAGTAGLRGMEYRSIQSVYSPTIPIVRPLLSAWREEIDRYCKSEAILPCVDLTNQNIDYFRNRIRYELIPELGTYNTQAKSHIWNLSMLTQPEDEYMDTMAKDSLTSCLTNHGDGFFALERKSVCGLPVAIQRRVVRKVLGNLKMELRDIGLDAVEKAIAFVSQDEAKGEWQLLDDVWISKLSSTKVLIYTGNANFSELWPLIEGKTLVKIPGVISLNENWTLKAEVTNGGNFTGADQEPSQACFDLDALKEELYLSAPSAGERIEPFGDHDYSQKLSDLFINEGVHRKARENWPILHCGNNVLWALGVRRAKFVPVNPGTKRILVLTLERRMEEKN